MLHRRTHNASGRWLAVLMLHSLSTSASVWEGRFEPRNGFSMLIGSFAFDSKERDGTSEVGVISGWVASSESGMVLAIYSDQRHFWRHTHHNASCDCHCRLQQPGHAHSVYSVPAQNTDSTFEPWRFQIEVNRTIDRLPHYWFVTLAKCDDRTLGSPSASSFRTDYSLQMVESDGSQVPVSEYGLQQLYKLLTLVWVVVAVS